MLTRSPLGIALIGAAAFLLFGAADCTGDTAPSSTPAPASTIGAPSATSTLGLTPSPVPTTNADAATAAAQKIIGDLTTKRCAAVPQGGSCNRLTLDPLAAGADFDHGLAVFNVTASAGDNFVLVLGRDQGGRWSIYLWGTRFYNATRLPANVTICGFGEGADVHSGTNPSTSEIATLDDGTSVNAEQFVLTINGAAPDTAPLARQGFGWYRISEPAGWVYSKYVSETADCALHDSLESR